MFLSRMALDMSLDETRDLVRSPVLQRTMVYGAFPPDPGTVLWRIDSMDGRLWAVLLSRMRPDLMEFHELCGYAGVFPSWHILDYDDLLSNLDPRHPYDFELCACTFSSVHSPHESLQDISYLRRYLVDQGKHGGFDIASFRSITSVWKVIDGEYILFAWWKGSLFVTDMDMFSECTEHGIGFHHDLGAGLLTLQSPEGMFGF